MNTPARKPTARAATPAPSRSLPELIAMSDNLIAEMWNPTAEAPVTRKAIRAAVAECCPDWSPADRAAALELVSHVMLTVYWTAFNQVFPLIGAAQGLGRAAGRAVAAIGPRRSAVARPRRRTGGAK